MSVVAVFKNEAHILEEWIQHYIYHGVDHFYLINDGSTDNYMPIVDKYKNHITLFQSTIVHEAVGRQCNIYNSYILSLKQESKWFAVLDLDEFLYSPSGAIDLKEVLRNYETHSQIKVLWHNFGSNGHLHQPQSVVEGFTRRAPCKVGNKWYSYKSIVRSDTLTQFGIHDHNVSGSSLLVTTDRLVINHYQLQSLNWYLNVKGTRGDVNRYFDHVKIQRNKKHFEEYDNNEIEDLCLLEQNKHVIHHLSASGSLALS